MWIDERNDFLNPELACRQARAKRRQAIRLTAFGAVLLLGFLFLASRFAFGVEWQFDAYRLALIVIGAASVIAGLLGVYRQTQRMAALKAQPPDDVPEHGLGGKVSVDAARSGEPVETTYSAEDIERFKRLLADARRPREPVFGPDGGPVAAPPPPVDPIDPPAPDNRPPLPPERWRTVP